MPETATGPSAAPIVTNIGDWLVVTHYPSFDRVNISRSVPVAGKKIVREKISIDMSRLTQVQREQLAGVLNFAICTPKGALSDLE